MNCKKCNEKFALTDLICLECGEITEKYNVKDSQILSNISSKVSEIKNVINKNVFDLQPYMWSPKVKGFAEKIEQTKVLLNWGDLATQVPDDLNKQIENFLQYSAEAEVHIALVGAIKAGKSSLINALLEQDLASVSVTPETASLTKFRSSSNAKNSIKVSFYSEFEWNNLWKSAEENKAAVFINDYKKLNADEIKNEWVGKQEIIIECDSLVTLKEEIFKWSSSKTANHYFVRELEISLADFKMPKGIVFVDTPGLDDVVDYRSNITRQYIDRANAVLVCVRSEALTGSEMNTILRVFANTRHNPEKVYVIGTKYDALNNPEGDWDKQKNEWLKYLEIDSAYGSRQLAEKNLIITSGMLYQIAIQEKNIESNDPKFFNLLSVLAKFKFMPNQIEENQDKLIELSNLNYLKSRIESDLVLGYQQRLIEDIEGKFKSTSRAIKKFVDEIRTGQIEILEVTQKSVEEIIIFKNKQVQLLKELESERNELKIYLADFESQALAKSSELLHDIRSLKLS